MPCRVRLLPYPLARFAIRWRPAVAGSADFVVRNAHLREHCHAIFRSLSRPFGNDADERHRGWPLAFVSCRIRWLGLPSVGTLPLPCRYPMAVSIRPGQREINWDGGVGESWSIGVVEYWSAGVLDCWSAAGKKRTFRAGLDAIIPLLRNSITPQLPRSTYPRSSAPIRGSGFLPCDLGVALVEPAIRM